MENENKNKNINRLIGEISALVGRRNQFLNESINYSNFAKDTIAEYKMLAEEMGAGSNHEARLLGEAQKLRERSRERVRNGRKTMSDMYREMQDKVSAVYVALGNADEAVVRRVEPVLVEFEDVLAEWMPADINAAWEVL